MISHGRTAAFLQCRDGRIDLVLIISSVGLVFGSFLLSWIVQKLLMEQLLLRGKVESGVRLSINRLVHYSIVFIGFILAISMLGFEITKLTIILSALGVVIGFGLQGVVNNFVSGLVLLFERPIRVGDYIVLDGTWCEIKWIGLRATTFRHLITRI